LRQKEYQKWSTADVEGTRMGFFVRDVALRDNNARGVLILQKPFFLRRILIRNLIFHKNKLRKFMEDGYIQTQSLMVNLKGSLGTLV
jgi:hypothetical protein